MQKRGSDEKNIDQLLLFIYFTELYFSLSRLKNWSWLNILSLPMHPKILEECNLRIHIVLNINYVQSCCNKLSMIFSPLE